MNPTLVVRVILLALGILLAVAHWLIPRFTRPDLYFAVTVAPGFRDGAEGRSILRRYRRELLGVSALSLAVLVTLVLTPALPLAPLVLLLQLGAYFAVYFRARRQVLPHTVAPTTVREARLGERPRRIPGGPVIASGPFVLLAACASYLYTHYDQIPARLVRHWGVHGQPDRWAARSVDTVFWPFAIAAAILFAMTLLLYGIAHWLRPIYASGPEGEHESRFRRTASTVLLAVEYWIAVLFSYLAISPLLPVSLQRPPPAAAMLPGLIAVAAGAILMWLGQGGSRIPLAQQTGSDSPDPVGDRTEDRFWKLGVFYFNRNDSSVLVEKRFGIGYSVNFAHPVAWLIILLPLLAVLSVTATIAFRHMPR